MGAEKRGTLKVVYSTQALRQLDEIADWNEQQYGSEHAAQYIEFLERHIDALANKYELGLKLGSRPDLRYIQIRRRSKGHGHVAVYKINGDRVDVLHVFHTAQNWRAKLA